MINDCSDLLNNIDRLEAVSETGLFGTEPEAAFTRLNSLATKILKAPVSIFSLIGDKTQFFKSAAGFEITNKTNECPLDLSVCQYALQGKPLSIENTKNHPLFINNPAVQAMNIVGYLGIPVVTKSGHAIGAVCVIDHKKRTWTQEEIDILQDITASFISEIELRQAITKIKNESNLREEFIAIASHELKNPLNALKLQTQMIQKRQSKGKFDLDDNQKFLSNLERQTNRLELLIDDMSDATRLSTGKFSLNKQSMSMNQLVEYTLKNLEEVLFKADCSVKIDFQSELEGRWDSSRIEQVLTNIISNSAKYAAGSPIEITLSKKDNFAVITIKDFGPGIAEENQELIFNKYGRANESDAIQGLGLGLYISRQIVEEHKGTLELTSSIGHGSSFQISLPQSSLAVIP